MAVPPRARRHKALVASIVGEMNHEPTEAEMALVERAAALSVRLDFFNAQVMRGETPEINEWCRISDSFLNTLERLGVLPTKRRHGWGY